MITFSKEQCESKGSYQFRHSYLPKCFHLPKTQRAPVIIVTYFTVAAPARKEL